MKLPSYTFYEGNVVLAHKKVCCLFPVCFFVVVVVSFSFPFFHRCSFFTLLASISHFLIAAIKFSCCSSREIRLLCFYLSRWLFLCQRRHQSLVEKRLGFVFVFSL